MSFSTLLFDLDDTVYPADSGIWDAIGIRMDQYMITKLGFNPQVVESTRNKLFHEYGTTLRGLKSVYHIDEVEFLDYVHDIPLREYLSADKTLADTLTNYPQRKIIFTNASREHAKRVLSILGIDSLFNEIIDVLQIQPYCKPFPEAYEMAIRISGISSPKDCVVIDDSIRNLETASKLGFFTVQVGHFPQSPFANASVRSLSDLPDVLPVQAIPTRN